MPINRSRFYLGTIGAISALPPLVRGGSPDVTAIMIGATHQALSGRTTHDIFAYKRNWRLSCTFRSEAELSGLITAYRRTMSGPYGSLYLLDGRRTNCLSMQISTGGSEKQSTAGFVALGTGATLSWQIATGAAPGWSGQVLGCQQMVASAAGQSLLSTAGTVPVIAGSSYLFSSWASGSGSWAVAIQPYDMSGVPLAAVVGPTLAVPASWQNAPYASGLYTPGAGVGSFSVGWTCQAAGTLNTTGWQVETDPPGNGVAPWQPGVGFPAVFVTALTQKYGLYRPRVYPSPTYIESQISLQEV